MSRRDVLERCADGKLMFDCPGCGSPHAINVDRPHPPRWQWNGDMERPTFKPSIRVRWNFGKERTPKACHSFVTDGQIKFLMDCTHQHAGKTLPLPPIETEDA